MHSVGFDELNNKFNFDEFCPVDGKLVRLADHYSAFLEASVSIRHGITSTHLKEGRENLINAYKNQHLINGIDAALLFADA